jgi:hypothetical protein
MTYVDVVFGNRKISISEKNVSKFQEELDQVLVLMGLSDMSVSTEGSWTIQGKGEKKGWGIDFRYKEKELLMSVVMKLPRNEVYDMKWELEKKYPLCVLSKLGGFSILGSEEAMIELLQKIKYKI